MLLWYYFSCTLAHLVSTYASTKCCLMSWKGAAGVAVCSCANKQCQYAVLPCFSVCNVPQCSVAQCASIRCASVQCHQMFQCPVPNRSDSQEWHRHILPQRHCVLQKRPESFKIKVLVSNSMATKTAAVENSGAGLECLNTEQIC